MVGFRGLAGKLFTHGASLCAIITAVNSIVSVAATEQPQTGGYSVDTFTLKEGMRIGTASAATQIEGGALEHTWTDWYRRGRILDELARACDHYNRWHEDDALMHELGSQIARIGVEWPRGAGRRV